LHRSERFSWVNQPERAYPAVNACAFGDPATHGVFPFQILNMCGRNICNATEMGLEHLDATNRGT